MRRVGTAIAAVAALLAIVGLLYYTLGRGRQPSSSVGSEPIRIAFNTWIGYSGFYIAQEEGLFSKRGIKVETKVIETLAEKNAAILRGELDGMGGSIDSAVISIASGVDGALIFQFDRSNGADGVLASSKVRSIGDLAGKSVALEEGFVGHFFLLYLLDKNGIPRSSVKIVPMSTDEAGAAFAAGKVDVAVTWEPYLSTANKRPGGHVLISSADIEPILAGTLFMSKGFMRKRPDATVALVQALQEANDLWLTAPAKYNPMVAKRWGLSIQELEKIMKTIRVFSRTNQLEQFGSPSSPGRLLSYLSKCSQLWLDAGVIKRAVDAQGAMDAGPVSTALKAAR
jgi:NitT/TauT family transport system substrate-binding protein